MKNIQVSNFIKNIQVSNFIKNIQVSNFMKIHPVVAELFHADGRIDRHEEANSLFSQFCESPPYNQLQRHISTHIEPHSGCTGLYVYKNVRTICYLPLHIPIQLVRL